MWADVGPDNFYRQETLDLIYPYAGSSTNGFSLFLRLVAVKGSPETFAILDFIEHF